MSIPIGVLKQKDLCRIQCSKNRICRNNYNRCRNPGGRIKHPGIIQYGLGIDHTVCCIAEIDDTGRRDKTCVLQKLRLVFQTIARVAPWIGAAAKSGTGIAHHPVQVKHRIATVPLHRIGPDGGGNDIVAVNL